MSIWEILFAPLPCINSNRIYCRISLCRGANATKGSHQFDLVNHTPCTHRRRVCKKCLHILQRKYVNSGEKGKHIFLFISRLYLHNTPIYRRSLWNQVTCHASLFDDYERKYEFLWNALFIKLGWYSIEFHLRLSTKGRKSNREIFSIFSTFLSFIFSAFSSLSSLLFLSFIFSTFSFLNIFSTFLSS